MKIKILSGVVILLTIFLACDFMYPMDIEAYYKEQGLPPPWSPGTSKTVSFKTSEDSWFTLEAAKGVSYILWDAETTSGATASVFLEDMTTLKMPESALLHNPFVISSEATQVLTVKILKAPEYSGETSKLQLVEATNIRSDGTWKNGRLPAESLKDQWYSLDVVKGNTYFVQWNDEFDGDNSKTAEVKLSAYRADGKTTYFSGLRNGYSIPQTLIASTTERVLIKVANNGSYNSEGSFSLRVVTAPIPTPLSLGTWTEGALSKDNFNTQWYSLDVVQGKTYYVQWNDFYDGDNTKIANIAVSGFKEDGTTAYFTDVGDGYNTPQILVASATEKLLIKVTNQGSYYSEGTFGLRVSEASAPSPLTLGVWTDGALSTDNFKTQWYSLDVVQGNTYYVQWKDYYEGDNTTTADVGLSAYRADGTTSYFREVDRGFITPKSLVALATEKILIKVTNYSSNRSIGNFALRVSEESAPIPLTLEAWTDGVLSEDNFGIQWYSVDVVQGNKYYVQWNDYYDGDNTKTANIAVSGYKEDGATAYFSNVSAGYDTPQTLVASATEKLLIKVTRQASYNSAGTFGLRVFEPSAPIPLTLGAWTDGVLSKDNFGIQWYSVDVIQGTTYSVQWNDYFSGNGTKTIDVSVSAYRGDGTTIYFSLVDSGYTNPRKLVALGTEKLLIKVTKYGSSTSTGTFSIKVSGP